MTVILISAALLIAACIGLYINCKEDFDNIFVEIFCVSMILLCIIALVVGTIAYVPAKRNSEIMYEQLQQEKISIEKMLDNEKDIDRIRLNELVIDYNNRVIRARNNSQRFGYRDYYSNDVDWMSLETIDWR